MAKNTTNQNKSKSLRLSNEHIVPQQNVTNDATPFFLKKLLKIEKPVKNIIYSLGCLLVGDNDNPAYLKMKEEYKCEQVDIEDIPCEPFDLLGTAYQFLNTKQKNLSQGSFYTGYVIAKNVTEDLTFDEGEILLDPACGSGAFLFASNAQPSNIIGVDFDPIAIMIAKFNYFIKFPDADAPNITCCDFFEWYKNNRDMKYDYIIGNPPYGADLETEELVSNYIVSGESFSYFIEYSFLLLKEEGILRFILPESILNIRRHSDIRTFILNETNLTRIKKYSKDFSGVMSDVYMLELKHGNDETLFYEETDSITIKKSLYQRSKYKLFISLTDFELHLINKIEEKGKTSLKNSIFALGVVTGDNKTKLHKEQIQDSEPIYTGKEIVKKYSFLPAKNFLVYNRDNLQQVAPDNIYRAKPKLVYKTVSTQLKFVIDESGSLTTNSANIVIPKIQGMSIYSVLGILNSTLFSFYHYKVFGGVNKIAKENLMALPLPLLTPEQDSKLKCLVKKAIQVGSDAEVQNFVNNEIYELNSAEIQTLKKYEHFFV